jgi:hypothetical protein
MALIAACAHEAPGAADTLAAFGAAVERKDYAAAYALTSASYRQRVPFAAFRSALDDGGGDTQAQARNLRSQASRGGLRASVELDDEAGQSVVLVEESGAWRLDGQPFEPWSQATPRAALRSFVRALERRRYDVVLRLSPTRHRAGLTAETLRAYWEGEHAEENARLLPACAPPSGRPSSNLVTRRTCLTASARRSASCARTASGRSRIPG